MTQTDSIKLAFLAALAVILAAFALAGAETSVLYEGMTCELIEGNGTEGLQCQELDNQGNIIRGVSIGCGGEYEGLCQQARATSNSQDNTTAPRRESRQSSSRASSSPNSSDDRAQEDVSCQSLGNNGLECRDNRTGAWFSTTCDFQPDLCQEPLPQPNQDLGLERDGSLESAFIAPLGSDASSQGDRSEALSTQINALLEQGSPSAWEQFSEGDLLEAGNTLNRFVAEKGNKLNPQTRNELRRLEQAIHYAHARSVSRRVIAAVGQDYFSRDGIYEKPKRIKIEGILTADTAIAQLLRDVSLWQECQARVRHVDMIKQCGDTPFGQARLFRY